MKLHFISDHSKGFGGKFGVEKDRQDASAEGYDYKGKVEAHESQKGALKLQITCKTLYCMLLPVFTDKNCCVATSCIQCSGFQIQFFTN